MKTFLVFVAGAALCLGGDTQFWSQSDFGDFSKGVRSHLAIRSDGRLSLAPKMSEIYDSSTPYLWALARDSKGNLYTAGGPGASVFRIPPGGKPEQVAQFDALEVHA
ncbi:MAG: hypothetical protein KGN84_12795, partial [Acidobacteriota bacterium]|nr:hypothetical protein [Acidobacteriota bacterium]